MQTQSLISFRMEATGEDQVSIDAGKSLLCKRLGVLTSLDAAIEGPSLLKGKLPS